MGAGLIMVANKEKKKTVDWQTAYEHMENGGEVQRVNSRFKIKLSHGDLYKSVCYISPHIFSSSIFVPIEDDIEATDWMLK